MSWSNSWIGKPAAIKAGLARYGKTLTEASQREFEAVRPALETLLDQNGNKEGDPVLHLDASGHGYTVNGERQYSQCSVSLRTLGLLTEE
jgi:hypothetical protein